MSLQEKKIILGKASGLRFLEPKDGFSFDVISDTYLELTNIKRDCLKISLYLQYLYLFKNNSSEEDFEVNIVLDYMEDKENRTVVASMAYVLTVFLNEYGIKFKISDSTFVNTYKNQKLSKEFIFNIYSNTKNIISSGGETLE